MAFTNNQQLQGKTTNLGDNSAFHTLLQSLYGEDGKLGLLWNNDPRLLPAKNALLASFNRTYTVNPPLTLAQFLELLRRINNTTYRETLLGPVLRDMAVNLDNTVPVEGPVQATHLVALANRFGIILEPHERADLAVNTFTRDGVVQAPVAPLARLKIAEMAPGQWVTEYSNTGRASHHNSFYTGFPHADMDMDHVIANTSRVLGNAAGSPNSISFDQVFDNYSRRQGGGNAGFLGGLSGGGSGLTGFLSGFVKAIMSLFKDLMPMVKEMQTMFNGLNPNAPLTVEELSDVPDGDLFGAQLEQFEEDTLKTALKQSFRNHKAAGNIEAAWTDLHKAQYRKGKFSELNDTLDERERSADQVLEDLAALTGRDIQGLATFRRKNVELQRDINVKEAYEFQPANRNFVKTHAAVRAKMITAIRNFEGPFRENAELLASAPAAGPERTALLAEQTRLRNDLNNKLNLINLPGNLEAERNRQQVLRLAAERAERDKEARDRAEAAAARDAKARADRENIRLNERLHELEAAYAAFRDRGAPAWGMPGGDPFGFGGGFPGFMPGFGGRARPEPARRPAGGLGAPGDDAPDGAAARGAPDADAAGPRRNRRMSEVD